MDPKILETLAEALDCDLGKRRRVVNAADIQKPMVIVLHVGGSATWLPMDYMEDLKEDGRPPHHAVISWLLSAAQPQVDKFDPANEDQRMRILETALTRNRDTRRR